MKNTKGFAMLELVLSAVIILLLITSATEINIILNKELAKILEKTNKLIFVWNRAERNIALSRHRSKYLA